MKWLIPVDGSQAAERAVDYAIAQAGMLKQAPQLHVLNVQWPLATANVKLFIDKKTIDDYYREQSLAALAASRAKLDKAGLGYTYHVSIGVPAETIVQYVRQHGIDQILMGASGETSLSEMLLGSVADKVVRLAPVPVLLIKA